MKNPLFKKNEKQPKNRLFHAKRFVLFLSVALIALGFLPNIQAQAIDGYRLCKYKGSFGYYSYEQCDESEKNSADSGNTKPTPAQTPEVDAETKSSVKSESAENKTASSAESESTNAVFGGLSEEQIKIYNLGIRYYNTDTGSNNCVSGSSELDGHQLPATKGGSAVEEQYNSDWGGDPGYLYRLGVLDGVSDKALYIKYGMNMRFDYVKANWNGNTSDADDKKIKWYSEKPRIVLVTNPRTGKSVRTVALDYGPAPWTGTKQGNSAPSYWSGFYYDSEIIPNHPEYKGRVSGISSAAAKDIDMTTWVRESGDELEYSWSDDQESPPGPTSETASSSSANCSAIDGDLAFPLAVKSQKDVSEPELSSHNYNANDLMADEGTQVLAFQGGKVTFANQKSTPAAGKPGGARANISITSDDWTVTYIHLKPGSLKFANGDTVKVGDVIGEVGNSAAADNTPPHLHIDAVDAKGGARPSCSRLSCPKANKDRFIDITTNLLELYNKLPKE